MNAEDPYSGLLLEIDKRAQGQWPPGLLRGTVLDVGEGRLVIQAGGMTLDEQDLMVDARLWPRQEGPFRITLDIDGASVRTSIDTGMAVITPEYDSNGQLIFRDNLVPMVQGKDVLILISTVNSGISVRRVLECVAYYGGKVQGVATVFSVLDKVDGVPIYSLFTPEDIPGYITQRPEECAMCRAGKRIDALANSYGISRL